jgi:SSS family solute:Na+ symporter
MDATLVGVIAYVLVQFAIGAWVSRWVKTNADFIIAGRTLGLGLVSFSVYATFFGAEAIVATAGSVYAEGLAGSRIDPFGYAAGIVIVGLIFAVPLWRRGLITFADLFRERYSPPVEKVVVLVLLPGSMFWAAAQIRAFGQVMSATSGLNVTVAISVAAVLVVGYSVLGGLLADAWTDLVQGLSIILGLLVLAIIAAGQAGGFGAALDKVESERLQALTLGDAGMLAFAESLAIPICGTVVAVELVSRILGARTAGIAAKGAVIGGLIYLAVGSIPVFLGLMGPQLVPQLDEVEQIVPKLAEAHLPGLLYVMFAGAVISAILSTIDSVLLASAAQVSHNIIEKLVPGLEDRGRLLLTRLTLVAVAIVAFVIALRADRVKELVELASAVGSAGVFVVAVFGLFTRFGGPRAAMATVIVGGGAWLVFGWLLQLSAPYIAALSLAFLTYIVAAVVEPRRKAEPITA